MSYAIMSDMFDIDFAGNDGVFRLAGLLARYASDDGRGIWASVKTLAAKMFRGRRAVQKHLKKLRDAGVIIEVASQRKSREYRINLRLVRSLREGNVTFAELLGGSVSVSEDSGEVQEVLPGFEGLAPVCEHTANACSRGGERTATQISNINTIPRERGVFDILKEKIFAVAGSALNPDMAHGLNDLSEVRNWLEAGADLDNDVLPVIDARSRGKDAGSVYSWKYYRRAVLAALARRTAIVDLDEYRAKRKVSSSVSGSGFTGKAVPSAGKSPASKAEIRQRNYEIMLEGWRTTGYWDHDFGPEPVQERKAS